MSESKSVLVVDLVRRIAVEHGAAAPTDQEAVDIAWSQTGYPSFWNIPADGATPIECMEKQLRRYFREGPMVLP